MMTELETYLRRGQGALRRLAAEPIARRGAKGALYAAAGFVLSGASLAHRAQPLTLGLICGLTGWRAGMVCLGAMAGYGLFWGGAGTQGMVWAALAFLMTLLPFRRRIREENPALDDGISGLLVAVTGLVFQLVWQDDTPVSVYLLRVALAAGATELFAWILRRGSPMADWLGGGTAVLALAQLTPLPGLNLGFLAAGALAGTGAFPAAAIGGLALDLAGVTRVPMAAVMTGAYLLRLLPWGGKWLSLGGPALVYLGVMCLSGIPEPGPLPALLLGGALSLALPGPVPLSHRRGATGMAQVRLELMAGVLSQTQQLLLEVDSPPVDEEALTLRLRERACGGCPNRKQCREVEIPAEVLHRPLTEGSALPFLCRKPGRMLLELRRSQEQLRALRADRDRQREYREAVIQQYRFLGDYLRQAADGLSRRDRLPQARFTPEVAVCSAGRERANGDRCAWFAGTENRYYILLCDGMGTGPGAAQEGQTGVSLLRRMLTAGFPAEHALGSLNAITALRGWAGAVSVDLAELDLTAGSGAVYKWGAAPSWLLRGGGAEKIGTATPPPGISVAESRETVDRLSLRRGETLILCSDGVEAEKALRRGEVDPELPPGELAAWLLEQCPADTEDDGTCVVIRLHSALSK